MTLVRKTLPLLLALTLDAFAIDKDKNKFAPPELDTLQTKLTISDVTVGTVVYDRAGLAEAAFGKVNPYEHGILPVLVIIRNGSKGSVRLDRMRVEYHDRDKQVVTAIPANEVQYTEAPSGRRSADPRFQAWGGRRRIRSPLLKSSRAPSPPRCFRRVSRPTGSSISVRATVPARVCTSQGCRKPPAAMICFTLRSRWTNYLTGSVTGFVFTAAGFGFAVVGFGAAVPGVVAGFGLVAAGFAAAGFALAGAGPTRATVTRSILTGVFGRLSELAGT